MSSNNTTLWELLNTKKIVIPKIQRDYAQGRRGKEYIRRLFLSEIKNHLESDTQLTLDFVYGTTSAEANSLSFFMPIDGQQRLTTLWLIYWFVALKTKELEKEDIQNTLKNFSYETRVSSRSFCEEICNSNHFNNLQGNQNVAQYIINQPWFYSAWLQDPTISSMLRTIGGENSKKENNDDNINDVFMCSNEIMKMYWKKLTEDKLISFELMNIGTDKLPLSDDIYIKMNARGKSLTDFENFKADLISWISNETERPEMAIEKEGTQLKLSQYYSKQLDTEWTDVFWSAAKDNLGDKFDGRIDEIFFSFINRFILNRVCLSDGIKASDFESKNRKDLEESNKRNILSTFDTLYGSKLDVDNADDSLIKYEGFGVYKEYITPELLGSWDLLFKNYKKCSDIVKSYLGFSNGVDEDDQKCSFIPSYTIKEEKNSDEINVRLASTNQRERVYFYAVCRFLEGCEKYDEGLLKKWMRVCRNLIENTTISNVSQMVNCLREIKKLADRLSAYEWDTYHLLKTEGYNLFESPSPQFKEEVEKAKIIIEFPDLESEIIKAETYMFFTGSIRFLFTDFTDEKENINWEIFEPAFSRARELFPYDNSVPFNTMKELLKYFNSFNAKLFFTSSGNKRRNHCWKRDILCKEDFKQQINGLLLGKNIPNKDSLYEQFLQSEFVEKMYVEWESAKNKYHYQWYNNDYAFHKENTSVPENCVFISESRVKHNCVMIELKNKGIIDLVKDYNYISGSFIWGADISFTYQKNNFNWINSYDYNAKRRREYIYLLDENGQKSSENYEWELVNPNELNVSKEGDSLLERLNMLLEKVSQ